MLSTAWKNILYRSKITLYWNHRKSGMYYEFSKNDILLIQHLRALEIKGKKWKNMIIIRLKKSWSIAKYPVFPLYFAWCCHWWWEMREQQKQISWLNWNSLFPEWQNDPMSHCKLILVSLNFRNKAHRT